jgi:flagellar biosynthetic protein FliP
MTNHHHGIRTFVLHVLEMLLVMAIGMGVFSALAAFLFSVAGSSLMAQPGWLRVALMGVNMTVPMVLWMLLRGHTAAQNAEMAASMLVPSALAALFVAAGTFTTATGFVVQHVVMVPAMIGVMLLRYDEYAHHGSHRGAVLGG